MGLQGGYDGYREAGLRPKRPLGMAFGVIAFGKQAEDLARPGPEGGRIVNASRNPPTPGFKG